MGTCVFSATRSASARLPGVGAGAPWLLVVAALLGACSPAGRRAAPQTGWQRPHAGPNAPPGYPNAPHGKQGPGVPPRGAPPYGQQGPYGQPPYGQQGPYGGPVQHGPAPQPPATVPPAGNPDALGTAFGALAGLATQMADTLSHGGGGGWSLPPWPGQGGGASVPSGGQGTVASPAEAEVLRLTNLERARGAVCGSKVMAPVGAVAYHPQLTNAARGHSQDMLARNYFEHTSPEGRTPADRTRAAGYPSGFVGENIAHGYATPDAVVRGWMNSPGHCENIMTGSYRYLGVGLAERPGQRGSQYWTQKFGGGN